VIHQRLGLRAGALDERVELCRQCLATVGTKGLVEGLEQFGQAQCGGLEPFGRLAVVLDAEGRALLLLFLRYRRSIVLGTVNPHPCHYAVEGGEHGGGIRGESRAGQQGLPHAFHERREGFLLLLAQGLNQGFALGGQLPRQLLGCCRKARGGLRNVGHGLAYVARGLRQMGHVGGPHLDDGLFQSRLGHQLDLPAQQVGHMASDKEATLGEEAYLGDFAAGGIEFRQRIKQQRPEQVNATVAILALGTHHLDRQSDRAHAGRPFTRRVLTMPDFDNLAQIGLLRRL